MSDVVEPPEGQTSTEDSKGEAQPKKRRNSFSGAAGAVSKNHSEALSKTKDQFYAFLPLVLLIIFIMLPSVRSCIDIRNS